MKSNMLPIHGSASSKWIQLPFDCPNGWFSWRKISLIRFERAKRHCGWKERQTENPERTPTLFLGTAQKHKTRKIHSKSTFHREFIAVSEENTILHDRQKCKWKSENSIFEKLSVCHLLDKVNEWIFFSCRSRMWKKYGWIFGCILHRTRNAYKSYTYIHSVTLIRSVNCESLRILCRVRVCFFSLAFRMYTPTSKN